MLRRLIAALAFLLVAAVIVLCWPSPVEERVPSLGDDDRVPPVTAVNAAPDPVTEAHPAGPVRVAVKAEPTTRSPAAPSRGTATRAPTLAPVSEATIRFTLEDLRAKIGDRVLRIGSESSSFTAPIDPLGLAVIEGLPPHTPLHAHVSEGDMTIAEVGEFILEPGETRALHRRIEGGALVTGRLVRERDDRPLTRRGLWIVRDESSDAPSERHVMTDVVVGTNLIASTSTDGTGAFRFDDIRPGTYRIGRAGYSPIPTQELVIPRDTPHVSVTVRTPELTIEGIVFSPDGTPAPAIRVTAEQTGATRATSRTRHDGTFRLGPVWPGRYDVSTSTVFGPGAPATVQAHAGKTGVELRLERGATVSGRVRDAVTGGLLAATVRLARGPNGVVTSRTDDDGVFSFSGLAAGPVHLSASTRTDLAGLGPEVTLRPGEDRTGVDIAVSRAASIEVHVAGVIRLATCFVYAGGSCVATARPSTASHATVTLPADVELTVKVKRGDDERAQTVKLSPGEHRKLEFDFDE